MKKVFCDKCGKELDSHNTYEFLTYHYVDVEGNIRPIYSAIRKQPEPSIFVEKPRYQAGSSFEAEVCEDCFKKIWESFKK